ncbi:hypothetical protein O181_021558 [Austropuccinia psidii MF-1]|uniref:Uncharacterized protein n=1 Tax=Austropuccinia psidii MF-1 TaxID=1389203 RepID=A0A9Q3CF50_9BASI|nr:hypothetical protein [Austropuccinia psidii MF-1]
MRLFNSLVTFTGIFLVNVQVQTLTTQGSYLTSRSKINEIKGSRQLYMMSKREASLQDMKNNNKIELKDGDKNKGHEADQENKEKKGKNEKDKKTAKKDDDESDDEEKDDEKSDSENHTGNGDSIDKGDETSGKEGSKKKVLDGGSNDDDNSGSADKTGDDDITNEDQIEDDDDDDAGDLEADDDADNDDEAGGDDAHAKY